MRHSTIIEKLLGSTAYGILPEQYKKFTQTTRFRLWTLASNFPNENGLRKIIKAFPNIKRHDLLLMLEESPSIAIANGMIAKAREKTLLPLFLLPPKRTAVSKPKPFGMRR